MSFHLAHDILWIHCMQPASHYDAMINDMSGLGVKPFLPALIMVNIGQQLHLRIVLHLISILRKEEAR
jgi:hypothetical protein